MANKTRRRQWDQPPKSEVKRGLRTGDVTINLDDVRRVMLQSHKEARMAGNEKYAFTQYQALRGFELVLTTYMAVREHRPGVIQELRKDLGLFNGLLVHDSMMTGRTDQLAKLVQEQKKQAPQPPKKGEQNHDGSKGSEGD